MVRFWSPASPTNLDDLLTQIDLNMLLYWWSYSPVLYMPFDKEAGSSALDRSNYRNHGTLYGASRVAGKVGQALSFDGVDDYVRIPDAGILKGMDNLTCMAWLKLDAIAVEQAALEKFTETTNMQYILGYVEGSGRFKFYVGNDATFDSLTSITVLATDVWYHIAGVYSKGSRFEVYLNGVLDNSAAAPNYTIGTGSQPLRIGRVYASYLDGLIDEVRIYDQALTAVQIAKAMNLRGIGPLTP